MGKIGLSDWFSILKFSGLHILFFLQFLAFWSIGQDKIYFINNTVTEASVLNSDSTVISYKKFNNPEGPVFYSEKKEIAVIEFADGRYKTFKRKGQMGFSFDSIYTKRKIFSVRLSPVITNGIGVQYEKISENGNWSFRVPVNWDFISSDLFIALGSAFYLKGQEKYGVFGALDVFTSITDKKSGVSINTGFRANWNQKFSFAIEIGAALIIKKAVIFDVEYPGILTPGIFLSYRI